MLVLFPHQAGLLWGFIHHTPRLPDGLYAETVGALTPAAPGRHILGTPPHGLRETGAAGPEGVRWGIP